MRVMIVDDYNTMLRILRNLLRQLDINTVEEATDGEKALDLMRRNPFDLVISDWNMAPMTGLDLLRAVRADEKLRRIPFIMVTAESKTENVITAKQAGVSNYIVKPFNAETLRMKIESVFAKA
jgi:two-component system chemotaxis response regulator CheY